MGNPTSVNTRRFVSRVLLIHFVLLAAVIFLVVFAAREIYQTTRAQIVANATAPQALLAAQTADGISSFYASLRDDMDLLRHAASADLAATPPATQATQPTQPAPAPAAPPPRPVEDSPLVHLFPPVTSRLGGAKNPTPQAVLTQNFQQRAAALVGMVLWKQLEGRVSHLFSVEENRLAELERRFEKSRIVDERDNAIHSLDNPNRPLTPGELQLIGKRAAWIRSLDRPAVSSFVPASQDDEHEAVNLVVVPLTERNRGRRALVADVPLRVIDEKFLLKLREEAGASTVLVDEQSTIMTASDPSWIGLKLKDAPRSQLGTRAAGASVPLSSAVRDRALVWLAKGQRHTGSVEVDSEGRPLAVARVFTVEPLTVLDSRWTLIIGAPLSEAETLLQDLFRKSLTGAILAGAAMTAILVSTALQLIRGRVRLERLRHDLLSRELEEARKIQLAWLPDPASTPRGADLAATNLPASHISGDFYNWFELPDGRLVVTIGDVTGHGMSAAFLMATTQLLVRTTMTRLGDPGACLTEVNRQLCLQTYNHQFVTMLIVVLDVPRGEMRAATAGHYPPLLSDGESYRPLTMEPQLVMGVEKGEKYPTERFALPPRASLLLYTDGVLDATSPAGGRFNAEGLQQSLRGRFDSSRALLDQLVKAVDRFRGRRELPDDLTAVAIQVDRPGREQITRTGEVAEVSGTSVFR